VPLWTVREHDGALLFDELNGTTAALPRELYLRTFLPLDVTKLEDVLAFCQQFGRIDDPFGRTLPLAAFAQPEMTSEEVDLWIAESEARKARRAPQSEPAPPEPPVVLLAEVATYHACFHNMVLMWRYLLLIVTDDEKAARQREAIDGAQLQAEWRVAGGPVPSAAALAPDRLAALLGEYLHPALAAFRVRIGPPLQDPFRPDGLTTYEAMCLQLANHIAEGLPYLECAAPDCRRLFVRTEGYDKHGQNRLRGASHRYCSDTCASRVRQQRYRQRQADKTREAGGTVPPDTTGGGSTP
jgi:hypothetical protein